MGILTLQDARLLCDKRMTYTAVGGSLYAEYAIRPSSQKGRTARARKGTLPGERFRDAVRGYSSGR